MFILVVLAVCCMISSTETLQCYSCESQTQDGVTQDGSDNYESCNEGSAEFLVTCSGSNPGCLFFQMNYTLTVDSDSLEGVSLTKACAEDIDQEGLAFCVDKDEISAITDIQATLDEIEQSIEGVEIDYTADACICQKDGCNVDTDNAKVLQCVDCFGISVDGADHTSEGLNDYTDCMNNDASFVTDCNPGSVCSVFSIDTTVSGSSVNALVKMCLSPQDQDVEGGFCIDENSLDQFIGLPDLVAGVMTEVPGYTDEEFTVNACGCLQDDCNESVEAAETSVDTVNSLLEGDSDDTTTTGSSTMTVAASGPLMLMVLAVLAM